MGKDITDADLAGFGMQGQDPFMEVVDKSHAALKAKAEAEEPEDEDDDDTGQAEDEDLSGDGDTEADDDAGEDDPDRESSEDEDDEELDEEDEGDGEEEEPAVKLKNYRLTLPDGSQVKVTDDATFKIKENGKFVRRSVQELIQAQNENIKNDEIRRRESEEVKRLQSIANQSEQREKKVRELVKSFSTGITKGNLLEALGAIRQIEAVEEGQSLTENELQAYVIQALNGMTKGIREATSKDPETLRREVEAYNTELRLKAARAETEELTRAQKIEAAKQEKRRVAESLRIKEDDMLPAYEALVELNKELEAQGQNPRNFTIEDVGILVVDSNLSENFKKLAKANGVELDPEDLRDMIQIGRRQREKAQAELSQKDYRRILQNYATKEIKAISRNLGDSPDVRMNGSSKKSNPKRQRSKNKKTVKEITRTSQAWGF